MHLYPMQRILVCSDFSESSNLALKAAEELRKRSNGSIDLIHITEFGFDINDIESTTYRDVFLNGLKKTQMEKLTKQIQSCGVNATPLIKDGNIVTVLRELADRGKYDLIVMGHGRSPLMSHLIGSTAYKMISHTTLPLLLVKKPMSFERVTGLIDEARERDKLIIATYNFFEKFKFKDVGFVSLWIDLPEPFGNQHEAMEIKDNVTQEVNDFCPPNVKPDIKVAPTREVKIAEPLNELLKETHSDVAVLKKFSTGNMKRIYLGSTSKSLLERFDGNLLIIPPS